MITNQLLYQLSYTGMGPPEAAANENTSKTPNRIASGCSIVNAFIRFRDISFGSHSDFANS